MTTAPVARNPRSTRAVSSGAGSEAMTHPWIASPPRPSPCSRLGLGPVMYPSRDMEMSTTTVLMFCPPFTVWDVIGTDRGGREKSSPVRRRPRNAPPARAVGAPVSPRVTKGVRARTMARPVHSTRVFKMVESHWTLRTGSVSFWTVFNEEQSLHALERYLDSVPGSRGPMGTSARPRHRGGLVPGHGPVDLPTRFRGVCEGTARPGPRPGAATRTCAAALGGGRRLPHGVRAGRRPHRAGLKA